MKIDSMKRLQFSQVVLTTLRPAVACGLKEQRKVILIELTVPWGERYDQAFEWKPAKYQNLLQDCWEKE